MLEHLPVLQVVVPLVGALLAALTRRPGPAWIVTTVVSALVLLIAALLLRQVLAEGPISYHLGGWDPSIGIEYRVDVVNALILLLISAVSFVIAPFARRSVTAEIDSDRVAWFYTMYMLALAGLMGVAITGDAFNAFVFLEISSLSSYAMVAMGSHRKALFAAYQYLIIGTIGATFYVIGVGLIFAMTGTLNFSLIAERIVDIDSIRPIIAALAFIMVGIGLKLALFPLHGWLPNAYAYAPSVASIFLAATATKVAIYLFLRFLFSVFGAGFVFSDLPATAILTVLSTAAVFVAGAAAVFQSDIKRMFAYSSVAQVGYITLGIALATNTGLTGGMVHVVNHGLIKAALFMAIGALVFRTGVYRLDELAGVGRKMPMTAAAIALAGLGLVGVPGTVGFVSKWYLIVAAFELNWWWLAFVIVGSSLLTVVYVGRVIETIWFREPGPALDNVREAPADMLIPIWLLVGATIYFGIDTNLTVGVASQAAAALLEGLR
jgi:multicomponent Na+:H+ antiporter subunit D